MTWEFMPMELKGVRELSKKEYNGYRCIRKNLITEKEELKFLGKGHD